MDSIKIENTILSSHVKGITMSITTRAHDYNIRNNNNNNMFYYRIRCIIYIRVLL